MTSKAIDMAIARVAAAIGKRNQHHSERVVLVGIQTRGVHMARSLAARLETLWHHRVLLGELDVAMHRDDLHHQLAPQVHPTAVPFDVDHAIVVLVDDVLCSGRTCRAALDALLDLGRPKCIQLAVLVDRGLREMPIQADFVGKTVKTVHGDRVRVSLPEDKRAWVVHLEKHRQG